MIFLKAVNSQVIFKIEFTTMFLRAGQDGQVCEEPANLVIVKSVVLWPVLHFTSLWPCQLL